MSGTMKRIHIVINPAAGGDEPILNTINDVFHHYGIEWDVSVTHKYGDATEFARQAAEAGLGNGVIGGFLVLIEADLARKGIGHTGTMSPDMRNLPLGQPQPDKQRQGQHGKEQDCKAVHNYLL